MNERAPRSCVAAAGSEMGMENGEGTWGARTSPKERSVHYPRGVRASHPPTGVRAQSHQSPELLCWFSPSLSAPFSSSP